MLPLRVSADAFRIPQPTDVLVPIFTAIRVLYDVQLLSHGRRVVAGFLSGTPRAAGTCCSLSIAVQSAGIDIPMSRVSCHFLLQRSSHVIVLVTCKS